MEKRIALIGANGQIGRELTNLLNGQNTILLNHNEFDIGDFRAVNDHLMKIKPDVVINTAAYHKVDECEKNPKMAFLINADSVRNLADICSKNDLCLIHFSSDYVFDGNKREPYTEDDIPNPLNVYGKSKLEGENYVRSVRRHLLIRTSYVFGKGGSSQKRTNLVETLLNAAKNGKVRAVYDHFFSPTYAKDLALKICELIKKEKYGLFHMTNFGECSVYDFAKKIYEFNRISPEIKSISLKDINSDSEKAKRPSYSVLTSINLKKNDISPMREWRDALKEYLEDRIKNGI